MEDHKKTAGFRSLLRTRLAALLGQFGYALTFDNQHEDQKISQNWIFRLQFSGKHTIEIQQDDWRDYTEYFIVKLNGTELLLLNIEKSERIEAAFEELKAVLIDKI